MKLLTVTKTLLILGFLLSSKIVWGQRPSCTQVLADANTQYSEGRLTFIEEDEFNGCFRADGYSKEERVAARRLVTLVHIYEDRIPEAEDAMVQLLNDDPEHPIDETLDPYEFVYLYNKFRTKPIFRVGFRLGATRSTYNLIDEFGVDQTGVDDQIRGELTPEIGLQGGVYIDYNFWNRFEASLGLSFAQRNVKYDNGLYPGAISLTTVDTTGEVSAADDFYGPTSYTDNNSFLDLPLFIKYNIPLGQNFVVYPYGGVIGSFLISASRSGTRIGGTAVNPGSINLKDVGLRESLNYSYTAGIGFKIRNGVDYFVIEGGYGIGGNNFVDPDGRYQNNDLIFRLGQIDGNQGIDFVSFTVGYQKSFYNPKKLKEFR